MSCGAESKRFQVDCVFHFKRPTPIRGRTIFFARYYSLQKKQLQLDLILIPF